MQAPPAPTEDEDKAPIPIETVSSAANIPIPTATVSSSPNMIVSNDADMTRTVRVYRKAAKRTLPWDLATGELELMSPPSPQAEDKPPRMKPRIEKPLPTTTDEAAIERLLHLIFN
jgi:hypothetical protein